MKKTSLGGRLLEAAMIRPDKICFVDEGRDGLTVTYAQYVTASRAIAIALKKAGVLRGHRVALFMDNGPLWCMSYTGVMMAGGMNVPVDVRLGPHEVENIVRHAEAKVVVYESCQYPWIKDAALRAGAQAFDASDVNLEVADPAEPLAGSETYQVETASLLYTSGTTGVPKGVVLTHANLLADADAVIGAGFISSTDVALCILPLHHTYAFMCTFIVPVLLGACTVFPREIKGPAITEACRRRGVTVIVAVPQVLELILQRIMGRAGRWAGALRALMTINGRMRELYAINFMKAFFRPLGRQFRFFTSGGARLEPEVMCDMEALGFTVLEGYGLTETSPIVSFNPIDRRKPGSVGLPLPSADVDIACPDDSGIGEIAIRGPMVMGGYYKMPSETARVFNGQWFLSGDLGRVDDEGYIFIAGRRKEVIVLPSGRNVYPEDVERMYEGCPLVKELCVFDLDGRVTAVIVPDTEEALRRKVASLREFLRWEMEAVSASVPEHMRVKGFELRKNPLPRTPLGKIMRHMVLEELRAEPSERPAREPDEALMADETGRRVAGCVARYVEDETIRADDNLELDLGLDSMGRLELVAELEREFGISIEAEDMVAMHSVGDIVAYVKKPRQTKAHAKPPMPEWLLRPRGRWIAIRAGTWLMRQFMRIAWRLKAKGVGEIPLKPCIIAPNHLSYMDAFVVAAVVRPRVMRNLYFMGIAKNFGGSFSSRFGRFVGVIKVDADTHLEGAMHMAEEVLASGGSLVVFPEGGRSFDGAMMEFKKGIWTLARKTGAPVVPARIRGTFEIYGRHRKYPSPGGRVEVAFGRGLLAKGVDAEDFLSELKKRIEAL